MFPVAGEKRPETTFFAELFNPFDSHHVALGRADRVLERLAVFGRVVAIDGGIQARETGNDTALVIASLEDHLLSAAREKHAAMLFDRRSRQRGVLRVSLWIGHVNACAPIGRHGSSFTIEGTKLWTRSRHRDG